MMKMTKVLTAVAGLSIAGSAMALNYGSDGDAPPGTGKFERHALAWITEQGDCDLSLGASAPCVQVGSIGSHATVVFENTNATTCTAASAGGSCVPANVVDTYSDASQLGLLDDLRLHSPLAPVLDPVSGAPRDIIVTSTFNDSLTSYTTDAAGKIIGGVVVADSDFAGSGTIGVFIFPEMVLRTYRGVSSDAGFNGACATNIAIDYTTCDNGTTVVASAEQVFDYVTDPMGQATAKAVPVPAFAAAALGLGLVGVTVLTGRRRQAVK